MMLENEMSSVAIKPFSLKKRRKFFVFACASFLSTNEKRKFKIR